MLTYEPWKIIRLIGQGSFGSVYEIEREELSNVYKAALKVISIPTSEEEIRSMRKTGMDDRSISTFFKSEASEIVHEIGIMNRLKGNTNIVSYEDHRLIPHDDGIGYDILIRMELLTPLDQYMAANGFSRDDVIRLGIDISSALERCRKFGIIHRDIKPDNIFVSDYGDFKLGDFGIARIAEKTQAGMSRKGTMNFMAPEVYRGDEYNHTVDIYSLGVVMYQLLNHGRVPFLPPYPEQITYKDIEAAIYRRLHNEPMPYPDSGQTRLAEIVLKACSFYPGDRYYEASEMKHDLEELLNETGNAGGNIFGNVSSYGETAFSGMASAQGFGSNDVATARGFGSANPASPQGFGRTEETTVLSAPGTGAGGPSGATGYTGAVPPAAGSAGLAGTTGFTGAAPPDMGVASSPGMQRRKIIRGGIIGALGLVFVILLVIGIVKFAQRGDKEKPSGNDTASRTSVEPASENRDTKEEKEDTETPTKKASSVETKEEKEDPETPSEKTSSAEPKEESSDEPEPATDLAGEYEITVWCSGIILDLTKKQIEDFNRNNTDGIIFKAAVDKVSESDASAQMIFDIEAGGDIFCFAQDQFAQLVQANALMKLNSDASEIVRSQNGKGAIEACTTGGELYAYPLTADNTYFMYYDKSVIPEEAVGNMEKIIDACEKAGRYIAFDVRNAWYMASYFFGAGCRSVWTTDKDGRWHVNDNFNSDEGVIAMKGLHQLQNSPMFLSKNSASEFGSGAAVVISGTWDSTTAYDALGDRLGAAPLPKYTVDGKEYDLVSYMGYKLLGVKPQSDSRRAAALHKLAQYLTGEQAQIERHAFAGWGPSNLNAQKTDAVQNDPILSAVLKQSEKSVVQGQIYGGWWDLASNLSDIAMASGNESTYRQALKAYQEGLE